MYKLNLDGDIITTFSSTPFTDSCSLTWNGENFVSHDWDNRTIFIGHTDKRVFLTDKFGIGTTSPAYKLDIYGSFGSSAGAGLRLRSSATDDNGIIHQQADGTAWFTGQETSNPNDYEFWYNNGSNYSHIMHLDNSGSIGIGTTGPAYRTTIYGGTDEGITLSVGSGLNTYNFVGIGLAGYIAGNAANKAVFALERTGIYGTGKIHFLNDGALDNGDATLADSKLTIQNDGNVGIGTTSPSQALEVAGQYIKVTGNNAGLMLNDTSSGSNFVVFSNGDNLRMVVDGGSFPSAYFQMSTAGHVGLGANADSTDRLTVAGNIHATSTVAGASVLTIDGTSGTIFEVTDDLSSSLMSVNTIAGLPAFEVFADYHIVAGRYNQNDFYLDTNGNLGLGRSNPNYKLHVNGNVAFGGNYASGNDYNLLYTAANSSAQNHEHAFYFPANSTNDSVNWYLNRGNGAYGYWNIDFGGTSRFYIGGSSLANSGHSYIMPYSNLGIGTTIPVRKLHVEGTAIINTGYGGGTYNDLSIGGVNGWSNDEAHRINFVYGGTGNYIFQTIESYYNSNNIGVSKLRFRNLYNGSSNTDISMTILGNGNVGIGEDQPSYKLHVSSSSTSAAIGITGSGGSKDTWTITSSDSGGYGVLNFRDEDSSTTVLTLRQDGHVGIGLTPTGSARLQVYNTNGDYNAVFSNSGQATVEIRGGESQNARLRLIPDEGDDVTNADHFQIIHLASNNDFALQRFDGSNWDSHFVLDVNGNVGIGATTPKTALDVFKTSYNLVASFGGQIGNNAWTGIHFGYIETANVYYRKSALVFERQDSSARGKIHILNNDGATNASATLSDSKLTIQYDGNVGIGTTAPTEKLEVNGNIKHQGLTMTSGTNIDQLSEFSQTLTISTSWGDTGISSSNLATGTYIVQLFVNDYSVGGGQYSVYYSGTMSWYGSGTNDADFGSEIILHRAGHADNGKYVYLRTLTQTSSVLKLQIAGNYSASGSSTYTFKFRRMI